MLQGNEFEPVSKDLAEQMRVEKEILDRNLKALDAAKSFLAKYALSALSTHLKNRVKQDIDCWVTALQFNSEMKSYTEILKNSIEGAIEKEFSELDISGMTLLLNGLHGITPPMRADDEK